MFWLGFRRQKHRRKRRLTQPVRVSATRQQWEETRNFLYYDGSDMPTVYKYKEEQHE